MALDSIKARQNKVQEALDAIQDQLFTLEGRYLEETNPTGNVVRGWDGYIDCKIRSLTLKKDRKPKVSERIFSYSSVTSPIPEDELLRELNNPNAPSPTFQKKRSTLGSAAGDSEPFEQRATRKKKRKKKAFDEYD